MSLDTAPREVYARFFLPLDRALLESVADKARITLHLHGYTVYKEHLQPNFDQYAHEVDRVVYSPLTPVYTTHAQAGGYYYALVRGRAPFALAHNIPLEVF
ncbi:MAG: hypothetical protein C4337_08600 [Armatimonadota bacterium]